MKFLVDAHLPPSLCELLTARGHDTLHTRQLPHGNATADQRLNELSIAQQRVLISKDSDFFYSHLLQGQPWKLLLIKTGNISTHDLCSLFARNLAAIEDALQTHTLVEIDHTTVTPVI